MIGAKMIKNSRVSKGMDLMALDTFGKRLRVLRIDREMSQIELRDKMEKCYGVSIGETYISELERTARTPTLEIAAAMARVLDVSLDYMGLLIDDATASYRRETGMPVYFSEEADQVAQMVDAMRPEQRALVVALVRDLSALSNVRQRQEDAIINALDSVQEKAGKSMRDEIARILRNKGFPVDPAP
jgi:transcriptional regulator with XRE-family HTH domain